MGAIINNESKTTESPPNIERSAAEATRYMYGGLKYILTDFNYATLTSPYIFQKTVECKLHLLR